MRSVMLQINEYDDDDDDDDDHNNNNNNNKRGVRTWSGASDMAADTSGFMLGLTG